MSDDKTIFSTRKTNERFLVLKNCHILTMNPRNEIIDGDILIDDGRIQALGIFQTSLPRVIDLEGKIVCPGFVQTHVHLCQTLFRGLAEDLELLDWLRQKIWPLEAAHTDESIYLSALLGGMELVASGTTTVLTMETVRYTESVFEAIQKLGMRAYIGKCLMDETAHLPVPFREKPAQAIKECQALIHKWEGKNGSRLHVALAPRFALSCSENFLQKVGELAGDCNIPIHSHAAENLREVDSVQRKTGKKNIAFFRDCALPSHLLFLAHCVWIDDDEMRILREEGMHVLHCPSSNLKLGSGIAMIPEMRTAGISVTLGADGAPCNNNLDIFTEMRLAALIQKLRKGPCALSALDILRMATIDGAAALGLQKEIGSIELGKKADLVILDREPLHTFPATDLPSALVYAYRAADVQCVIVDGNVLYAGGDFSTVNASETKDKIRSLLPHLLRRAKTYVNMEH